MLIFSHWEYEDGFWSRKRYPVYLEVPDRITITYRYVEPEVAKIERETRRLLAVRDQLDAEAAMLDSHITVVRKQAELQGLLELADQRQPEIKLIPHRRDIPIQTR
jgi:hypothetical protein